ncbi:hypothetical protein LZ30DRAFT_704975 [Colletotrichum cereale]|nr:hypothetical protein LZ30DRAFT_704975 [Colletotrichum cereale]
MSKISLWAAPPCTHATLAPSIFEPSNAATPSLLWLRGPFMHISCRDADLLSTMGTRGPVRRPTVSSYQPHMSGIIGRRCQPNTCCTDGATCECGRIAIVKTCVSWPPLFPPSMLHAACCRPATCRRHGQSETLKRVRVESQDANATQRSIPKG